MERRERKKTEQRHKIIDQAVKLFKVKGFDETSINDILDAADISKGTFYNYFPDKASILIPYFRSVFEDFVRNRVNKETIRDNLTDFYLFLCNIITENRNLFSVYFSYRMTKQLNNSINNKEDRSGIEIGLLGIITEAQKKNQISETLDPMFLSKSLSLLTFNLMLVSIHDSNKESLAKLSTQIIELFMSGAEKAGV